MHFSQKEHVTKNENAKNTARTNTNVGSQEVFQKRPISNVQIAMNGATDPIDLVNPFFPSFPRFGQKTKNQERNPISIPYFPL